MKTIAITIEEATLKRIDELLESDELALRSRSELIRELFRKGWSGSTHALAYARELNQML